MDSDSKPTGTGKIEQQIERCRLWKGRTKKPAAKSSSCMIA